jgi:hypothetical protein
MPIQSEFLCVYRGKKRIIRERPLTKAEKAIDNESLGNLLDKYSN